MKFLDHGAVGARSEAGTSPVNRCIEGSARG